MAINEIISQRTERTKWFLNDRFGMFIHWGLYAIPAKGEWYKSNESMSTEEYQMYFDDFDPINYDPKAWAKAAKAAGMKYAVLTAKHHDGFCLFDSKLTDYKSTNTKCGRDLVKEYLEAFRAEGLKVGLYYSIIDWHHEDFPAFGDRQHPMRNNEAYKDKQHNFPNYLGYMHGQVRELLTDYGKLDIMWFDFSYDNMSGEKWEATKLLKMIRGLQPDIIIDNRLSDSSENFNGIKSSNPSIYSGDFASPEQIIPAEGIVDDEGNSLPWEACITLNNNWGYHSTDKYFKSPIVLVRKLVECVSKNGNLLLNVGPNAKGEIPKESLDILDEIGKWMKSNGDSIYGCGKCDLPKPEWGRYTKKGNKIYAHVFEQSIGPLCLKDLGTKIRKARLLDDYSEILLIRPWNTVAYPNDAFINFGVPSYMAFPLPNDIDTVVEFELL